MCSLEKPPLMKNVMRLDTTVWGNLVGVFPLRTNTLIYSRHNIFTSFLFLISVYFKENLALSQKTTLLTTRCLKPLNDIFL